jgi:hypothetical protein
MYAELESRFDRLALTLQLFAFGMTMANLVIVRALDMAHGFVCNSCIDFYGSARFGLHKHTMLC